MLLIFLCILLPIKSYSTQPKPKTGYATYHNYKSSTPLSTVACSNGKTGLLNSTLHEMYPYVTAFSLAAWDSPQCGKCIHAMNGGRGVYLNVVDQCGGQGGFDAHFDIASPAFDELFGGDGMEVGHGKLEWEFVDSLMCRGNKGGRGSDRSYKNKSKHRIQNSKYLKHTINPTPKNYKNIQKPKCLKHDTICIKPISKNYKPNDKNNKTPKYPKHIISISPTPYKANDKNNQNPKYLNPTTKNYIPNDRIKNNQTTNYPIATYPRPNYIQLSNFIGNAGGGCTNEDQLKIALPPNLQSKTNKINVKAKTDFIKAIELEYKDRVIYTSVDHCFEEAEITLRNGTTVVAIVADICNKAEGGSCSDASSRVYQELGGNVGYGHLDVLIKYRPLDKGSIQKLLMKIPDLFLKEEE